MSLALCVARRVRMSLRYACGSRPLSCAERIRLTIAALPGPARREPATIQLARPIAHGRIRFSTQCCCRWARVPLSIWRVSASPRLTLQFRAFPIPEPSDNSLCCAALGAAMSATTYLITLTFFLSTPGVAEATAGGFPAISAMPGQFLLKDLVLLAASISLLLASVQGSQPDAQKL